MRARSFIVTDDRRRCCAAPTRVREVLYSIILASEKRMMFCETKARNLREEGLVKAVLCARRDGWKCLRANEAS